MKKLCESQRVQIDTMKDELVTLRLARTDFAKKLDLQMQEVNHLKLEKGQLEKLYKKSMKRAMSTDTSITKVTNHLYEERTDKYLISEQFKVYKRQAAEEQLMLTENINNEKQSNFET